MKKTISKVTSNPVGAALGGITVFWAAKKFGGVKNMWLLGAAAVVGVVAGANVQAMVGAKASAPTATVVKK